MPFGFPSTTARLCRHAPVVLAAMMALAGVAGGQPQNEPPTPPQTDPADPLPSPPEDPSEGPAEQPEPDPEPASAEPVEELETVIIFKDGRRLSGTLVSRNEERVILRVNNIPTPFGLDVIDRVESLPPVMERYRSMRSAIKGDDAARLVMLAQWLVAYQRYDLAQTELEGVLKFDPENEQAKGLLTLVKEQGELARKSKSSPTSLPLPPGKPAEASAEAKARAARLRAAIAERHSFPVLSAQDVNLIRVYELDLRDPPRLVVPRQAVEQILEHYASDPLVPTSREAREALFRKPAIELVELMFGLRARELYPMVEVLDHPRAIKRFRDDIHTTWLINACATTQCHGGNDAGRLMFATEKPNSDATVYTNLLILERFRTDDGKPLIDYENPARSPLLHAALPRDLSLRPHPKVETPGRGWKPIFNSQDDRRYQDAMRWIQSMYRPRPEYPVEYTPRKPLTPAPTTEPGNAGVPR